MAEIKTQMSTIAPDHSIKDAEIKNKANSNPPKKGNIASPFKGEVVLWNIGYPESQDNIISVRAYLV